MSDTLVQLPRSPISPSYVLHKAIEEIDDIEHVAIVILSKDGTERCGWSCMKIKDLMWCAMLLDEAAKEIRNGENPESIFQAPA